MTLGSDLGAALPGLRAAAESRMRETWRIGTYVEGTDPVTLDPIQVLEVAYDGPGRFKAPRTSVSAVDAAGQIVTTTSQELHLPSGTTGVEINMLAICDASLDDASMVGRTLRIDGPAAAGQTTAARFPVQEYQEIIEEPGS